jgi:molybdopterin converting factor small subunit
MIIKLKIYFYSVFDKGDLTLEFDEEAFVGDVILELSRIYGGRFLEEYEKPLQEAFGQDFNVFLNDSYLRFPEDNNIRLKDSDKFLISRPISGG